MGFSSNSVAASEIASSNILSAETVRLSASKPKVPTPRSPMILGNHSLNFPCIWEISNPPAWSLACSVYLKSVASTASAAVTKRYPAEPMNPEKYRRLWASEMRMPSNSSSRIRALSALTRAGYWNLSSFMMGLPLRVRPGFPKRRCIPAILALRSGLGRMGRLRSGDGTLRVREC